MDYFLLFLGDSQVSSQFDVFGFIRLLIWVFVHVCLVVADQEVIFGFEPVVTVFFDEAIVVAHQGARCVHFVGASG